MPIPSRADAKVRRSKAHVKHTFSIHNLLGDPFGISSITIAIFAWIITLGGSSAAVSSDEAFPRFSWWGIAYQLFMIFIMIFLYTYDLIDYYRNFLTGSNSVAFVYNTNSATNLIYTGGSKRAAASAGFVLMATMNLFWIFYFGGDNASPINRWLDSFSIRGIRPSAQENALLRAHRRSTNLILKNRNHNNSTINGNNVDFEGSMGVGSRLDEYSLQRHNNPNLHNRNMTNGGEQMINYMSSVELNGLENTEPKKTQQEITNDLKDISDDDMELSGNNDSGVNNNRNTYYTDVSNGNTETTMGFYSDIGDDVFPYKARALYSYKANENDAYEISFEQNELLEVSDIEGRWWKARRENGTTGIIPSNYVELIE
ncbi:hypothetical protein TBLA_0I01050 [Henningerozyma blattae CBS 6284]|uniref:High osmolarity signaling protein SHO1 n=1 Tax=Henningerozyma blattae (strain ATCC 34711 / CBS 6284 / DSM 70876 / NBRC 10599 / NRRL Y-10934 / UCD 77-7) TaxID=1071380 RepID=I2H8R2_HENB6|nr:hypothetical protein TBLA_0I01050 [Tetrapisispora blattae CBS 6284]CCH62764.1 hypothetical protein TBLA_0I01050 [Tetrapisispora blattae CBS 6284]